ncbi:heme-binding protein 2 [Phoenix dactylifera]|uniref:Heme-binding protein 2 n=1 Tax=Phoenix dactylifera TaxID=42345 RepID=A0A8B7BPP0_PHODC|nr:heme-binding protein 2 [Phoenix dactylifera]
MAASLRRPLSSIIPILLLANFALPSPLAADGAAATLGSYPPTCERIECPSYDVIDGGNGYEIRRYNSPVWMSTSTIEDISFVNATRIGFLLLFDYIDGKNEYGEKIEMTAPVITQVSPSDGPFCASSFIVSFYVPKNNQADPPPAEGLHVQKWGVKYAAVRQFGGFVLDSSVGEEAAALYASLQGSNWASAVDQGQKGDPTSVYTVAQYNSPFEFTGRVNEIWMMFDMEEKSAV